MTKAKIIGFSIFFLINILLMAWSATATVNLTDGLYNYYTFDNVLTDEMGDADATTGGATYAPGILENGTLYNAEADYVQSLSTYTWGQSNDFSLFFWINVTDYAGATTSNIDFFTTNTQSESGKVLLRGRYNNATSSLYWDLSKEGTGTGLCTSYSMNVTKGENYLTGIVYNGSSHECTFYLNTTDLTNVDTFSVSSPTGHSEGFRWGHATSAYGVSPAMTIDEAGLWDRMINSEEIDELYSYGYGCTYPFDACYEPTYYFDITATNNYGDTLTIFNATVNGTFYSTTNGTINTNVSTTAGLINITVEAAEHDSRTYTNYNVSSDLAAVLTYPYYYSNLSAINNYDENLTTFNVTISGATYSTTNGTITSLIPDTYGEILNITFNAANHDARTYLNHNISTNLTGVLNFSYYRLNVTVELYNGSSINTFNVSINSSGDSQNIYTTTGEAVFNVTQGDTYTIVVDPTGYTTNTSTLEMTDWLNNLTITVWPTNTVNISFYNESSNTLLTGINITAYLILDDTNATYNVTETGLLWIEDLSAGDYEIRYSSAVHAERTYFFTLTDRNYYELTLYLLDDELSEDITNTLYDEFSNLLEGYYIKLLRYYPSLNAYIQVDEGKTNFEGVTILRAIRNDPYYKFRITDSDGTVLKTTSGTQIYDTSITHYVTLGEGVGDALEEQGALSYSLTFLEASDQFRFNFDHSDGILVGASLYVYTTNPSTGDVLYNSTTVSTSSGTLYISVVEANETTYKAKAYVTFSGDSDETFVDQITYTYTGILDIFGSYGLFLTFVILCVIIAIGFWNPAAAVILVPAGLILTRVARLHVLEWSIITAITAVAVIILYLMNKR